MEETKFAVIVGNVFQLEVLLHGIYFKLGNKEWFLEK